MKAYDVRSRADKALAEQLIEDTHVKKVIEELD